MKKFFLIVSLVFITACEKTVTDKVRIDDYEFYSLQEFGKEIELQKDIDIIANIKKSKRIKGPVKGIVKTLRLVNKNIEGDTLVISIYGEGNYFRIDNDFYQAKSPILLK